MGNIIVIAILIIIVIFAVAGTVKRIRFGSSCCGIRDGKAAKVRISDKNKAHYPYTYRIIIEGMHCSNCSRRVENAFNSQDGLWASVNLKNKSAFVRAKKTYTDGELTAIVQKCGYSVSSINKE